MNYLHIVILVVIMILVILFGNTILNKYPILTTLFTDQISFILLALLCLFILLIDLPSGIIISVIVIYLGMSIKPKSKFKDIPNIPLDMLFRSDSEFYYKHKPIPNGNLPPFQPIQNETEKSKDLIPINSNDANSKSCLEPDFITRVDPPNRQGYDVTGCRYDFKESPQNLTIYGPPLSQCDTYNTNSFVCNGTVFYPLHE